MSRHSLARSLKDLGDAGLPWDVAGMEFLCAAADLWQRWPCAAFEETATPPSSLTHCGDSTRWAIAARTGQSTDTEGHANHVDVSSSFCGIDC